VPSDQEKKEQHPDIIIIGGGPAGSSAGAVLARKGHTVLLLEKQRFPRFHIGESLLPFMAGQLGRMQLLAQIEKHNFPKKFGTEFTDDQGGFKRIDFTSHGAGRKLYSYQVERSIFDNIMLQQAKDAGVQVLEEANVTRLLFEGEKIVGVEYVYQGSTSTARATYVIDASGRAGKIANHFRLRKMSKRLLSVAVYTLFEGTDEQFNPGWPGDTMIGHHGEGWIWAIPIREDALSVGVLTSKDLIKKAPSLEEHFNNYYTRIPRIMQRLTGAKPVRDVQAETDYGYHTDKLTGPGYLIVGDAGCFVDPIFSAGVYLGVLSGIKAAEMLSSILRDQLPEAQAMAHYENFTKTGYDCNFRLAYSFYDFNHDFANFILSNRDKIEERHIARAIGGDFWNPYNSVTRYLRTESKWDTFEPFEVVNGCPVYPELEAREAHEKRWIPVEK
jgi:FADH2-dependent halogenase